MTTTAQGHRATTQNGNGTAGRSGRLRYAPLSVSPFLKAFREAVRRCPPTKGRDGVTRFGRREQILHKQDSVAVSFEALLDELATSGADAAQLMALVEDVYQAAKQKITRTVLVTDDDVRRAIETEEAAEAAANVASIRMALNSRSPGACRAAIDALDREMAAEVVLREALFNHLWALEHPEEAA